jgi:hypothetical protein
VDCDSLAATVSTGGNRMRTRIGIVLTTVVLFAAGLVGGTGTSPAGAASTPSITVNPSSDLEDGQAVTIFGEGFTDTPLPSGWRALQCDSGILDGPIAQQLIAHCDPNGPAGVTAVAGTLIADFVVHRSIKVGEEGRPVTCGIAPADCALVIAGGTTTGGFVGAAAPISFGREHTVTVTPATGLSDGRTVMVTGTGWVQTPSFGGWIIAQCSSAVLTEPTIGVAVSECDPSLAGTAIQVPADAAGNIQSPFVVHTTFTTAGNPSRAVTCGQAPNDCAILIAQVTPGGVFVARAAPISFGKPVPTLRDCIRTFLADHEQRPSVKPRRLLVCIYNALTHKPT